MRYLGGKARLASKIVESIDPEPGLIWVEPFMGGCNVAAEAARRGCKLKLSDKHLDLVLMWRAVIFDGWVPPDGVSQEQYNEARHLPPSALRGFIGFGCSFGGKWFGGYARGGAGRNYASNAKNSIMRKAKLMRGCVLEVEQREYFGASLGDLFYCDPPYASTTGYGGTGPFSSEAFFNHVHGWGRVFVSEYEAPQNWRVFAEFETKTDMHAKQGKQDRTERLFVPA